MPRKKANPEFDTKQRKILLKLQGSFPIKDYRGVSDYISDLMEAHLRGVIKKEVLTGGVYAGGVLLQALKMAKDETDIADMLPDFMRQGNLEVTLERQEATAILTAGNMGVQVKLLRQKHKEGKIINVEGREIEEVEPDVLSQPFQDRVAGLISAAHKEDHSDLFADE